MKTFKIVANLSVVMMMVFVFTSFIKSDKQVVASVIPESHSSEFQQAFFNAAKVYGRANCGDQHLAEMTARRALEVNLPAQLIAAQIATESNCNPMAISNRGAIGLTQIMPRQWDKEFDFTKINLFNPRDNLNTGTAILSSLVKQYGLHSGLNRYYGTGSDGAVGLGGSGYADKILQLAGKL